MNSTFPIVEETQPVGLGFIEILDFAQSRRETFSPPRLLPKSCTGSSPLSRVAPSAPTGELLPSPIADGMGQPSRSLYQFGVGVDCYS